MCKLLGTSLQAVSSWPWLEIIKAAAPVATAFIALLALRNWKRQDKADRQAQFLDDVMEAAHTYIAEIAKPVTRVEFIKIAMESHVPPKAGAQLIDGAIAYIGLRGEEESKRLLADLEVIQPAVIRLRSLSAKGQVFKFEGYTKCQNAVLMLTWHFDRMEGFTALIGSSSVNWGNPEILTLLRDVVTIDAGEIRKSLQENNVALVEFATEAYRRMYG
ncbi:MAG: hypothetical protein JSS29_01525 [Proteobacteria bacterium]|nr:hypothetical protein [Pseudomonadota bacterium]